MHVAASGCEQVHLNLASCSSLVLVSFVLVCRLNLGGEPLHDLFTGMRVVLQTARIACKLFVQSQTRKFTHSGLF